MLPVELWLDIIHLMDKRSQMALSTTCTLLNDLKRDARERIIHNPEAFVRNIRRLRLPNLQVLHPGYYMDERANEYHLCLKQSGQISKPSSLMLVNLNEPSDIIIEHERICQFVAPFNTSHKHSSLNTRCAAIHENSIALMIDKPTLHPAQVEMSPRSMIRQFAIIDPKTMTNYNTTSVSTQAAMLRLNPEVSHMTNATTANIYFGSVAELRSDNGLALAKQRSVEVFTGSELGSIFEPSGSLVLSSQKFWVFRNYNRNRINVWDITRNLVYETPIFLAVRNFQWVDEDNGTFIAFVADNTNNPNDCILFELKLNVDASTQHYNTNITTSNVKRSDLIFKTRTTVRYDEANSTLLSAVYQCSKTENDRTFTFTLSTHGADQQCTTTRTTLHISIDNITSAVMDVDEGVASDICISRGRFLMCSTFTGVYVYDITRLLNKYY